MRHNTHVRYINRFTSETKLLVDAKLGDDLRAWARDRLGPDPHGSGPFQDHYGVDLKSIEWWCQEEEDLAIEPAAWMKVRRVPEGKNIDHMLMAVDDGLVDLDDTLETYIPGIDNGSSITMRHLLSMRSGVYDYTSGFGYILGPKQCHYRLRT